MMENELTGLIAYIAQLELNDIDELQSHTHASGSGSAPPNDEDLALLYFAEEAQGLLNIARDYASTSPGGSNNDTISLLHQLIAMEEMARQDREMAIALSEGREPPPRSPTAPRASTSTGASSSNTPDTGYPARSSNISDTTIVAFSLTLPIPIITVVELCTACGDAIIGSQVRAPCGHFYDADCLQEMFRKATVDESLFPPKCCQTAIPLESVRAHIGYSIADRFRRKSLEFTTTDRVYCYRSLCSAFLGAATEKPLPMPCPECSTLTCGACKEEAHAGRPCSTHLNEAVLAMAKDKGWQRCPACRHLVELNHGCFHMSCVCKKQFCYLCAATWKECSCPQFDEQHLLV